MENKDTFSTYHPIVNLIYFGLVLLFSMFFMHPVFLFISLLSSIAYHIKLKGKKSVYFLIRFAFPLLMMTAIINPMFNHQGTIIICYLPTGNALTFESIIYGVASAVMLVAVFLWFSCYSDVMTSDKFVYLFGRIIPSLSLVISMTLRFVPRFKKQFEKVREAQHCMKCCVTDKNVIRKIKFAAECFSIMVTWSLENAIETSDSMKSRGYGLKGRTSFSIYTFREADKYAVIWFIFCGLFILSGYCSNIIFWQYFPFIHGVTVQPFTVIVEIVYFMMCITPLIIDIKSEIKQKRVC